MNSFLKKAGLGVALGAAAISMAAAPAQAQRYRGYHGYHGHYHHGGDAAGAALLGGIVGLGVGAAIASNDRGRYYDNGGYYGAPAYYGDEGYYGGGGYYEGRPHCYVQHRWDPYYRGYVRVRVCN